MSDKPKFNVTEITHATREQAAENEAIAAANIEIVRKLDHSVPPDLSLEIAEEERRNHG